MLSACKYNNTPQPTAVQMWPLSQPWTVLLLTHSLSWFRSQRWLDHLARSQTWLMWQMNNNPHHHNNNRPAAAATRCSQALVDLANQRSRHHHCQKTTCSKATAIPRDLSCCWHTGTNRAIKLQAAVGGGPICSSDPKCHAQCHSHAIRLYYNL